MQRFLNKLFKSAEHLMALFLALMVFFVFFNVVLRYCFNSGLKWSEEAARYLFVWTIYIGAIGAARDNQHLIVRAFLDWVPGLSQKIIYLVGQVVTVIIMVLLTYGSIFLSLQNLHSKASATGLPLYLVYGIGILMGAGIALVSMGNIYKLLIKKMSVPSLLEIHGDPADMDKMN